MTNIPNFIDVKFVKEDGFLTDEAKILLSTLFAQLNADMSDQGLFLAQQDTATINSLNTEDSTGALIYNTDTNKAMINENGTFKTIQTL